MLLSIAIKVKAFWGLDYYVAPFSGLSLSRFGVELLATAVVYAP